MTSGAVISRASFRTEGKDHVYESWYDEQLAASSIQFNDSDLSLRLE